MDNVARLTYHDRCSYLHVFGSELKRDESGRWSRVADPPARIRAAAYWTLAVKEAADKALTTVAPPMRLCPLVKVGPCDLYRYISPHHFH